MFWMVAQITSLFHFYRFLFLLFLIAFNIGLMVLSFTLAFTFAFRFLYFWRVLLRYGLRIILDAWCKAYDSCSWLLLLFIINRTDLRVCATHVFLLLYYIFNRINKSKHRSHSFDP